MQRGRDTCSLVPPTPRPQFLILVRCCIIVARTWASRWSSKFWDLPYFPTVFLRSDAAATIVFAARFCAATILGRLLFEDGYYSRVAFISLESPQTQRRLDKVYTSDTVTTVRRCQYSKRSLSVLLSAVETSRSCSYYWGRRLLRSELPRVATIRGRRLIELIGDMITHAVIADNAVVIRSAGGATQATRAWAKLNPLASRRKCMTVYSFTALTWSKPHQRKFCRLWLAGSLVARRSDSSIIYGFISCRECWKRIQLQSSSLPVSFTLTLQSGSSPSHGWAEVHANHGRRTLISLPDAV